MPKATRRSSRTRGGSSTPSSPKTKQTENGSAKVVNVKFGMNRLMDRKAILAAFAKSTNRPVAWYDRKKNDESSGEDDDGGIGVFEDWNGIRKHVVGPHMMLQDCDRLTLETNDDGVVEIRSKEGECGQNHIRLDIANLQGSDLIQAEKFVDSKDLSIEEPDDKDDGGGDDPDEKKKTPSGAAVPAPATAVTESKPTETPPVVPATATAETPEPSAKDKEEDD